MTYSTMQLNVHRKVRLRTKYPKIEEAPLSGQPHCLGEPCAIMLH